MRAPSSAMPSLVPTKDPLVPEEGDESFEEMPPPPPEDKATKLAKTIRAAETMVRIAEQKRRRGQFRLADDDSHTLTDDEKQLVAHHAFISELMDGMLRHVRLDGGAEHLVRLSVDPYLKSLEWHPPPPSSSLWAFFLPPKRARLAIADIDAITLGDKAAAISIAFAKLSGDTPSQLAGTLVVQCASAAEATQFVVSGAKLMAGVAKHRHPRNEDDDRVIQENASNQMEASSDGDDAPHDDEGSNNDEA
ncbi:Aste57867_25543 [Aphanomyces stellatus]|uniref:Aste57867_25543 protein n=1 Tax=Aphanomyces stellatus TaxID=120398 RepID=A0A485LUD7_9STRA|nr:hypothetical protein As57867_025464 [Aphanomyces stellatus]VFU02166.1 Aste57867_25543 [Aphanomyces stellatus]